MELEKHVEMLNIWILHMAQCCRTCVLFNISFRGACRRALTVRSAAKPERSIASSRQQTYGVVI